MTLSDTSIRKAKPGAKPVKLFDGGGLYVLLTPTGSRLWRMKYRFAGKEKLLALGAYPAVSLKGARELRDDARRELVKGIDPGEIRRARKAAARMRDGSTFEVVAREWFELMRGKWEAEYADLILHRLERDMFSSLGRCPIADPKEVGALMRAIRGYAGGFETKCALLIGILTFVRPGELRKAEWSEFDFVHAEWRISASGMKMKEQHIVPLSKQSLAVLKELHSVTGHGRYVFPSVRTSARPTSENTVNAALRRLGYTSEQMTGHGFRSTASTLFNEQGWPADAIERQLSHGERDEVRGAYNFAE